MENPAGRDWLTKDEAETFIGKNSFFYLHEWKTHSNSSFKGWNWAAAVFSIEWMSYRKMYLEAVLFFLAVAFVSIVIGLVSGHDGTLVGQAFRVLAGIFGNAIYRKKALRTLRKTIYMDEPSRLAYLQAKGGVSIAGLLGCIAVQVLYVVLMLIM